MQSEDHYSIAPLATPLGEAFSFQPSEVAEVMPLPAYKPVHVQTHRSHGTAYRFSYVVIKRAMDIFTCIALVPVLAPLCGIIALLIKITSPGPAIFSHRRICKDGKYFYIWKFRTMRHNSVELLEQYFTNNPEAREEWVKTHKLQRDPRVTPLGNFLRRYSLDELPQIWNVFRGEMALVGPRPIVDEEVEKYGQCFRCYCEVKPGVTGLWQVSGRSELTYDERVALDCKFVREWSLGLDMKILFKTLPRVVNSNGAF